jgi:hypothetical protein
MSKCVAALLALALGGCAVYTLQTPLQDLRIGYTTTADVERMLGRPTRRTITQAGEEYWRYIGVNLGPGTQGRGNFYFINGILTHCGVSQRVGLFDPFRTVCTIERPS